MPTYEFRCPAGHEFERFYRSMSMSEAQTACPTCGQMAERLVSGGAGLVFKGSGFYLTDYGKNAHRGKAAAGSGEAKSGDAPSGESKGGDAKVDGKGEAKASEAKGGEAKGGEAKPAAAKPAESKPSETKSSSGTKSDK